MSGFVGVSRNPYFAVSDRAGGFRIENVPPGTSTLAAWQEKLGEKSVEITVEPRQTTKVVFHYGQRLSGVSIH